MKHYFKPLYFETLDDVLNHFKLQPSEVRVIRHPFKLFGDLKKEPFFIWREGGKEFYRLNAFQKKNAFGNQKFLASFVATPEGQTIFTKLYKINGQKDFNKENFGTYDLQPLQETKQAKEKPFLKEFVYLEGRLRIDWGKGSRSWNQIAGNNPKKIVFEKILNLDDLILNKDYLRQDLHFNFSGSDQKGIVNLPKFNAIFLINSSKGKKFGYSDGWSGGKYFLSGEGLEGDQKLTRGNKALAESINSDKRIFLFEPIRDRKPYTHRLIAELSCIDYEYTTEFDKNSQTSRKMFKFIFSGNSNNIGYKAQVKKDLLEELANELEEEMNEMNVSTKPRKISTSSYKVSQKQTLERKQKENELVLEYKEFVESSGFKAQHSQIDLIVENDNLKEFIEAKILKSATTAAHGLGQLLFYYHSEGTGDEKLALLFDRKPDEKTISFVHKYNVEIIYKKKNTFSRISLDT